MGNIHIKIEDEDKEKIKSASKMERLSVTSFIRRLSLKEAKKILEENQNAKA